MLNAWAEWGGSALGMLTLFGVLRRDWEQSAAALALWAVGTARPPSSVARPILASVKGPTQHAEGTDATEAEQAFKLFSANLYKRNRSAAQHLTMIREQQPDVICLQELGPDIAKELKDALGEQYPYQALRPRSGAYGFGVFSRFPIEENGHWERPGVKPWGQRVRCTLPEGEVIEVYNVHLVPPTAISTLRKGMTWGFRTREEQVRVMQQQIRGRALPACVVGDHNFADTSDAYRIAREEWNDAWQAVGQGIRWTWPTRDFPFSPIPWHPRMLRLDYCFYNDQLRATDMQILTRRTGSDHCPFVVTLLVDRCFV